MIVEKILEEPIFNLKNGKIILYPTDTIWGIGCDATNEQAVEKIFFIKNRAANKSFIILVDSIEMLSKYVQHLPDFVIHFLDNCTLPTTLILPANNNLAKNVISTENTIAIRICKDIFCNQLIKNFGKPIVSTSANISNQANPTNYNTIDKKIIEMVDYVVAYRQLEEMNNLPSSIYKISAHNEFIQLR